ncbi:sensor histidine kinase [Actinokineospora enzanensis]|uniref:sensor histidine kinase n=1 Tax=Actinokineospora enzanensis TaxID=155975 RepID=UPI00035D4FCC|nr:sensor histidine kinase [Actinokineospora enzanensis]
MSVAPDTPSREPFAHTALFYRTDEDYLSALVPFVVDGLARGDPVAAAVPNPRALRRALGRDAERVTWIDMREAGRNPGRIILTVLRRFADPHPDHHVRIIGEPVWPGRSPVEHPACAQHEALINLAFAGRDVTIVCPYDVARLAPDVVADARHTHPLLWSEHSLIPSHHYAPTAVVEAHNRELPLDTPAAEYRLTAPTHIRGARTWATAEAARLGLPPHRLPDLTLIVTELTTNSLTHGGGHCLLRLHHHDSHLVCEVHDSGHLSDPLAGRRPVGPTAPGGRGLVLVHQLADLVHTHRTPHGTTQYAFLSLHDMVGLSPR